MTNNTNLNNEIITIDEVVTITGYSKKYIYKLTSSQKIPFVKTKFGRKLFFVKAEILNWMQAAIFEVNY